MEKAGLDGYAVRDRLVETANILLQHIKSDG